MKTATRYLVSIALICSGPVGPALAMDLIHFIEAGDHARVIADASGLRIANDGVIYVTSEEKGTLLKIADGKIEAFNLTPSVFKDPDLGGIDLLPNGNLVIVNEGSGRVGILDPSMQALRLFSQSGSDPGELNDPGPVAVSVNNNIYVGDPRNRQISVFNNQGLFLHSFGKHGSGGGDLLRPSHVSLDAEENIYVLEGPTRLSIFNRFGQLLERFKADDLSELFGEQPEWSAMTADLNGTVYLGNRVDNRISIFDWRKREIVGQFGALGQSRSQYRDISYLSVNASGQLAILDNKNAKVEVFQLDQTSFATPRVTDLLRFAAENEADCVAVYAFIDDQTLCIKSKDQGIVILGADASERGKFAEKAQRPSAIHVGEKTVAILDKNNLHVFAHDGSEVFTIGRYGTSAGGFKDPNDVFVHGNQYYVADKGNNRVQVFAADGQFLEEIKAEQDGQRLFFEVGPIAVDSQKNLYVADSSAVGVIHVIDEERKNVGRIGIEGESIHKVTRYHALDIDQQDRLYALFSTEYNDYQVQVIKNQQPFVTFGAGNDNGTPVYFEEAVSLSVLSGAKNSVFVYDADRKKSLRFDFLEYPDAAFGLNIAANNESINLAWSSSRSPLISRYEIQAGKEQNGSFETIAEVADLSHSLPAELASVYSWFRVVSVSEHGLRATASTAKENQFQRIKTLYQAGEYADAVRLADRLLKIAPDNADARDLLGMSLFKARDYTRAIAEFKQLQNDEAFRNKAIRYQVQAYFELEQFLDARGLIDEVLEQEPTDVEPYLVCTRLSLELADAIGAVTCAEDGLEQDADHVELRYLLGRAYIEAGLAEEGLQSYQLLVKNNPDEHAIRLRIARDLYALGRFDETLAHYDAVLAADPRSGEAAVGKARALLSLDRDGEAKAIAVKLSGKKETKGDGYYVLGKIAAKQGNYKEAVLRLTRASKDNPGVVDAWASLANAYIELNQLSKATRTLAQGIEHNPQAFELQLLAGRISLQQAQYPDANTYLDAAVGLRPQSLQARKLYARGLYATRNYRSAAIHAEAAVRIAPDDIDVLVLQADIANQQGKTGSAIEFLKAAISLDAASPELQYRIGRVYQDANLFEASREHLERAAGIRPNWAEPHVALGNLYSKRRRFDDAVAAFEKAVELEPSDANRAILNVAFAERKKSLEFDNNAPQLLLSDLNLQRVFSAAYKKYQDKPIGKITVKNAAATDYGNLKLSFQIKEFMDFPSSVDISLIEGNTAQDIPITATFNNKILEVDEDTGVQVEVRLTYLRDGQKDDIVLTQPMTIYGKNAIVWGDAEMVGSFVTPKDDTLRDFVRQVINAYQPDPGPLNEKLVAAMAFFSSLTAAGTNYIVDPNTPFTELRDDQIDYVQFPRETLHLKSGDCDDLSVLISAGLENLGIDTALVEVPGHLFLMFNTGLDSAEAELISQNQSLLVIRNDQVWIPLEATMVNTSFNEAWAEGAARYQAAAATDELGIIELDQAWQQYRPVTLRKASYAIELPEPKRTASLVRQARNLLLAKSIDRLVLPYQTMVANDPQDIAARMQIAILYARYGLYEDAEIEFEALAELAPNNSAVKTNQGNLYFLQENYQRAVDNYTAAAELDSEDGGIWINLSMSQYKAGELKKARNSYQQAIELDTRLKQEYDAYSKLLSQ